MKLAIVTSHPIQYYAPWFKYMADYMDLHVFYMHEESNSERERGDFGIAHEWDVDLLSGYNYCFLNNVAKNPSVNHFRGCDIPEIYKIIKESDFDAVLVTGWYLKAFWQVVAACKLYGVPVLIRGDSILSNNKSLIKKSIKKVLYPIILNFFDLFLSVGQNNRKYLQYYGVDNKKIIFIPHFIDQEYFRHNAESSNNLKRELNISSSATILLFVGKFLELKRPMDILEAMNRLRSDNVEVEAIFVGSGKLEEEMKVFCLQNTNLKVHFVGFKNQSEVPKYYNISDILILPSSSETWGLVVNEAFSLLTPAIVSNQVGCMPDLIASGLTGDVYECGDSVALAEKIKKFILKMNVEMVQKNIKEKNKIYSMQYATENLINAIKHMKSSKK